MLLPVSVLGWNALGHRLVAQIAYDHMTPHTQQMVNHYNHALDKVYKRQSLVNSAVWLDTLRYQDINWFASMHYIDLPFADDGSPLIDPQAINAVWAIEKSTAVLLNRYATDFDKGIALRILLHVIGDLHQPLHAITKISKAYPEGDRGGNLVLLEHIKLAKNLHTYWDKGGGVLLGKKPSPAQLKKRASQLEQRWPCEAVTRDSTPMQWANESHWLAIQHVYKLPINKAYQENTQNIAGERIAIAGCRLAEWLNKIDEKLT